MSNDRVCVFIDTNIFLHYPDIDSIDWANWCNCEEIELVLCMQVVHELDSKKSDTNLCKRASRAIKKIHDIKGPQGGKAGKFNFKIYPYELKESDFEGALNFESPDDRIICYANMYKREHGVSDVVICTEDLGMQIRCDVNGVRYIEPDKATRLVSPKSEMEKKYDDINLKYKRLASASPGLGVVLIKKDGDADENKPLVFEFVKSNKVVDVERLVREEIENIGVVEKPSDFANSVVAHGVGNSALAKYKMYLERVEAYKNQYKGYVVDLMDYQDAISKSVKFLVVLNNDGSAPAMGVDLHIRFPPKFVSVIANEESIGKRPTPPSRPARPVKPSYLDLGYLSGMNIAQATPLYEQLFSRGVLDMYKNRYVSLYGDADSGFNVRLRVDKLKHRYQRLLRLDLLFKQEEASTFNIDIEIYADNIPDPVVKNVPIIVVHKELAE